MKESAIKLNITVHSQLGVNFHLFTLNASESLSFSLSLYFSLNFYQNNMLHKEPEIQLLKVGFQYLLFSITLFQSSIMQFPTLQKSISSTLWVYANEYNTIFIAMSLSIGIYEISVYLISTYVTCKNRFYKLKKYSHSSIHFYFFPNTIIQLQ